MNTYIALLRGINVGGKHIIKMESLRQYFENMGFTNVKTYIQSGNVVFESNIVNHQELATLLANSLNQHYSFSIPVIITDSHSLKAILLENPFNDQDSKDLFYTFLSDFPSENDIEKLKLIQFQQDEFIISGKVIYLHCKNGYGNTKLTNSFFERILKTNTTTRNFKTVLELTKLCI